MNTEIKKFDAEEAMLSVREKIRDSFASLIPEQQWTEMVKKEVDSYFNTKHNSSYSSRDSSTNFQQQVERLLREETNEKVKEYLSTNFNDIWHNGDGTTTCASKVEEIITKNAGTILADMIGGSISMRLQQAGFRT